MPKDTEIEVASTGGGRIATMQRRISLALWPKLTKWPWKASGFYGDIKGLNCVLSPEKAPFLLA